MIVSKQNFHELECLIDRLGDILSKYNKGMNYLTAWEIILMQKITESMKNIMEVHSEHKEVG